MQKQEEAVFVVSVVRDEAMYSKCVTSNPHLNGCRFVMLDNRKDNIPIPVRYNYFLDSCQSDSWIIFCHEDWELQQDIGDLLSVFDKDKIYGPIGAWLERESRYDLIKSFGSVIQCEKNGERPVRICGLHGPARVDTVDCQCVMIHSALVKKLGLRFDENLPFDMYVEDFCVSAFEKAGVLTMVVDMDCTHYSYGTISDRFFEAVRYVKEKYRSGQKRYASVVGYKTTFGKDDGRRVHRYRPDRLFNRLFHRISLNLSSRSDQRHYLFDN